MLHVIFISVLYFGFIAGMALVVFSILKLSSMSFTGAPYIEIPNEVLPRIVAALRLNDKSLVYDLGCGDGRVLIACSKKAPTAKYIGVDNAILPVLTAKFKTSKIFPKPNITIIKQNFFRTDVSSATHIFTYLFPQLMDSLLPKLERELSRGTRLVSCDFQFKNKKPVEIIDLHRTKGQLGKFLYVYEF